VPAAGPGPNGLQVAPALTAVRTSTDYTNLQGTLTSAPGPYIVQFFASPVPVAGEEAEGALYLGQTIVEIGPSETATFSADVPLPVTEGQVVTATATSGLRNTSQFSAALAGVFDSVGFKVAQMVVNEAAGEAVVTVVRNRVNGGRATVNYKTTNEGTARPNVDYTPVSGTLVFEIDEYERTFSVPILDNDLGEASETIWLALSDPDGGAILGHPSRAIVRIGDVATPAVTGVTVVPGPRGASVVVIAFNQGLIASRAEDLRNYGYSLSVAPPGRRPGTRLDRLVAVQSAVYDPASLTVTLTTATPIHPGRRLLLRINQVTDVPGAGVGVAGLDGLLIDGDRNGRPGGVYEAELVVPRYRRPAVPRGPRLRAFQPALGY
jgi:hypothetical protein